MWHYYRPVVVCRVTNDMDRFDDPVDTEEELRESYPFLYGDVAEGAWDPPGYKLTPEQEKFRETRRRFGGPKGHLMANRSTSERACPQSGTIFAITSLMSTFKPFHFPFHLPSHRRTLSRGKWDTFGNNPLRYNTYTVPKVSHRGTVRNGGRDGSPDFPYFPDFLDFLDFRDSLALSSMAMQHSTTPTGWLAFELSILHRLKFDSIAIPLTGDPAIGSYLKRRNIRVAANDLLQADWQRSMSVIANSSEKLSEDDVSGLLEDVYVPGYKLANPALKTWFGEVDSWWFDNVRSNLGRLNSPIKHALAVSLVTKVGDYALSFDDQTRELRQPLSTTFRRLWMAMPEPVAGAGGDSAQNKTPGIFVAEATGEAMLLRLPRAEIVTKANRPWQEEWLRGSSDFWPEVESDGWVKMLRTVETKSQYVRLVDDLLDRASHFKQWAVSLIDSGFISPQEIADIIGKHRTVSAIYTKDFSELTGKKAVIITA